MRAHVSPEAVQNVPPKPPPPPPPQHAWPAPPHIIAPAPVELQLPLVHVDISPPQAIVAATQLPPTQQAPAAPEQSLCAQQGAPGVPQATTDPPAQIMLLAPTLSPLATQFPDGKQQPPPEHTLFGQHACPAAPQALHLPFPQVPPFWHIAPDAMH
jgi:hypothetical protein